MLSFFSSPFLDVSRLNVSLAISKKIVYNKYIKRNGVIKMFKLTVKTLTTEEKIVIAFRENAEALAENYYECADVYAVEIINNTTGELLYYKSKG